MSVTSSATSGMVVNSCSTPSIFTEVIAAPCSERQEHPPQRVAQRGAEAALERLGDELAVGLGERVLVDLHAGGA